MKKLNLIYVIKFLLALGGVSLLIPLKSIAELSDSEVTPDASFAGSTLESIVDCVNYGFDEGSFMIVPLLNSGAGALGNGVSGAVVGFLLSGIDEALLHMGFDAPYYLTSAFLGAGILGNLELPYYLNTIMGVLGGLAIASGQVDDLKNYVAAPMQGLINGAVYKGWPGALVGGIGGVVDEVLKAADLTAGNYCSKMAESLALTKALATAAGMMVYFPKIGDYYKTFVEHLPSHMAEGVGILLFAYKTYNQLIRDADSVDNVKVASDVIADFHNTLKGVIDPGILEKIMQQHGIIIIIIPLLSSQMNIQIQRYCQNFDNQLANFKDLGEHPVDNVGKPFFKVVGQLGLFVVPYVGEFLLGQLINDYQGRKLTIAAQDAIYARLADGEMPLKLAMNEASAALLDALDNNVYSVAATGGYLVAKIAESQVKGIYSLSILSRHHALDFALIVELFEGVFMAIGKQLSEMQMINGEAMLPLKSQITSLQKEWHKNHRNIVYGNKQSHLADQQSKLFEAMRKLSAQASVLNIANQGFFRTKHIFLNFIIKYAFLAHKMMGNGLNDSERLPFLYYSTVGAAGNNLLESYSWYSQEAGKLMEFNQASANLKKLIGLMNANQGEAIGNITYQVQPGQATAISLNNFSVGHQENALLIDQTIHIPQGVYVVSGPSGSGKTSFLSKIQGIQYNNIWANGNVTYTTKNGQSPVIHQATQVDYMVPYSTLMEIITSQLVDPKSVDSDLENRVQSLLLEIAIDDRGFSGLVSELHVEKDWSTLLSGGQKRKIAIIAAILKNPDILIADEIFNGLDAVSVKKVQSMLKRYLPDTLFLIVDHNYELNNYEQTNEGPFYNGHISLENKSLLLSLN